MYFARNVLLHYLKEMSTRAEADVNSIGQCNMQREPHTIGTARKQRASITMAPLDDADMNNYDGQDDVTENTQSLRCASWWRDVANDKASFVELVARIMFPVTFVIFNAVYWPIYLCFMH